MRYGTCVGGEPRFRMVVARWLVGVVDFAFLSVGFVYRAYGSVVYSVFRISRGYYTIDRGEFFGVGEG